MATSHLKSAFAGALIICVISGGAAYAASPSVGVNGEAMGLMWIAPFAGMLLSIALLPLLVPHFWHRRYGLVSLFWAACFLVPFAASFGLGQAGHDLAHTLLLEYIPFVILIGALFTISGGIYVGGNLHGAPVLNVTLLLIGMLLASFAGTTGASMMLIRPLLRANDDRKHNVHVVVFFIFLVSNIGGALTPLGDPPLFLGYLQGVPFLWPLQHLWGKTLLVAIILLAAFFVIDIILYKREGRVDPDPLGDSALYVRGLINVPLFIALVAAVAVSGSVSWGDVTLFGTTVSRASLARDAVLLLLAGASLLLTPKETRQQNEFNWGPAIEVAKLFAAIFVTIIPAITILKAGQSGAFAPLLSMLGTDSTKQCRLFLADGNTLQRAG